jgi:hypothetical protein
VATQGLEFYSNADGSTATLVYDDVAMTASGVQVHVPATAKAVTVRAVISGQPVNLSYPPGTDTTYAFPTGLPFTIGTDARGRLTKNMPWLTSVGVSVSG